MKKYLIIVGLFLLVGCGQEAGSHSDISDEINNHLGIAPYLPEIDDPIGHVHVEYSPEFEDGEPINGEPFQATVEYKVSLDEKVDEEFKESWEEINPRREIIYGELYKDRTAVMVRVSKGSGEIQGAKTIEFKNHDVRYQLIERETKTVFMLINFEDIGYEIQYRTEENDIEEEAKAFAKDIINNND
ncbi:hypothetical protein CEY16_10070 [Halalkalibacillus sediminis]|uniref:DUF4367 domain-containing protein n=1 Tax=Halalkalibacillus sediminis TaxID=2018042 RepID=A0A2I0QRX2_9BACI|nr:hypothetical protein [Halalkalibacillus sediminis]PKR77084.1 hypothetical protein CEY16_10070 [Halalkalibacillus sediminis]